MRRVIVIGPPGSGKSTLARRLGKASGLPVFHLDKAYWRAGWVEAPAAEFAAEVEHLACLPDWIIDGNYTSTLPARLRRADTLIYLDVPSWRSTFRVVKRALAGLGTARSDMPAGCPERLDLGFLQFAWSWNRRSRARSLAFVEGFEGRALILRNLRTDVALRAILDAG